MIHNRQCLQSIIIGFTLLLVARGAGQALAIQQEQSAQTQAANQDQMASSELAYPTGDRASGLHERRVIDAEPERLDPERGTEEAADSFQELRLERWPHPVKPPLKVVWR